MYRAWMRLLDQFTTLLQRTRTANGKVSRIRNESAKRLNLMNKCFPFASLSRTCGSRHILLFHQPYVREQRQLHQEPGWLSVWHHLQDGECILYAKRKRPGALSQAGKVSMQSLHVECETIPLTTCCHIFSWTIVTSLIYCNNSINTGLLLSTLCLANTTNSNSVLVKNNLSSPTQIYFFKLILINLKNHIIEHSTLSHAHTTVWLCCSLLARDAAFSLILLKQT